MNINITLNLKIYLNKINKTSDHVNDFAMFEKYLFHSEALPKNFMNISLKISVLNLPI